MTKTEIVHTSVDIPKALHRKVAVKLARDAKSLREVIQEALESYAGAKA